MKKLIAILLLTALSGCMPSRGWQVNFGMSPVTAIDNNQQFGAPDAKNTIRNAKY